MKKNLLINLGILAFSTILTLVLAEFLFRFILLNGGDAMKSIREPSLYANYIKHRDGDFFDEDYWKLNYLFNKQYDFNNTDTLLGWVGAFSTNSRIHAEENQVKGRRPVLLFGDSFAQCVDTVQCFEDILNKDSIFTKHHFFLNFGVGGYGVDQIYLLFNSTIDRFQKPFVIFALLTTDMDRTMVGFRDAQKPKLEISNSGLVVKNVPITMSSSEYIEKYPPEIKSYLWNRYKNSDFFPFRIDQERAWTRIEKIKALNSEILLSAIAKLNKLDTEYLFLVFHPEHHKRNDWRICFLRDFFEKENVPCLFDLDIRDRDTAFFNYDAANYAIPGNGHPTTYLNELISKELSKIVLNDSLNANF